MDHADVLACPRCSLFLSLTPDQLLARIATLVPPPRTHAVRYHGVFAPNAKVRARVVPAGEDPGTRRPASTDPAARPLSSEAPPLAAAPPGSRPARGRSYRVPWAELLEKVFAVDVLACPRCDGRLEVIAFIAQPSVARQILDHLGLCSQAPPVPPAAAAAPAAADPPTEAEPEYDCVDPVFEE